MSRRARTRTSSGALFTAVVAATALMVSGCARASHETGAGSSPTQQPSPSTAHSPSATPEPRPTTSGVGPFAGKWFVHGSSLVIARNGKGSVVSNVGPCRLQRRGEMCNERNDYRFRLSPDGTMLTGTMTAISFETWAGAPVPASVAGYRTGVRVGDTMHLYVAAPGLLSTRWPLKHPLTKMLFEGPGNPFWCAAGTSNAEGLCGA
jgi:hypothetical protein